MATYDHIHARVYAMLPAAFLAQGARSVLATGWPLNSAFAATFVPDLVARYRQDSGGDVAAAYAGAQRAAIAAGRPVYEWATWMLIGNSAR